MISIRFLFLLMLLVAQVADAQSYDLPEEATGGAEFAPRTILRSYDDFLSWSNNGGEAGWASATSGTGALAAASVTGASTSHPGLLSLASGTTSGGRAGLGSSSVAGAFLASAIEWEAIVYLPILSDGTERFSVDIGAGDNYNTAGLGADRVAFRYRDDQNAGEWQAICRAASTETTIDTNIAVAATTWYRLGFSCIGSCTSIEFFINGTSVGSCSTNVPGVADAVSLVNIKLEKSIGTTARELILDLVWFEMTVTGR